jgi:hypothetical protein
MTGFLTWSSGFAFMASLALAMRDDVAGTCIAAFASFALLIFARALAQTKGRAT